MTDQAKLDMAVKYCSNEYADKLIPVCWIIITFIFEFKLILINSIQKAIEEWEKISDLIVKREKVIYQLESFERNASDPNRFYIKSMLYV